MGDEVDLRLHLDVAILVHVIELGPATFNLEPIYASIAGEINRGDPT